MNEKVSIEGLDKAEVLAALYNASKPQGMGFLHYDPTPMEPVEAAALLAETNYFDYLKGRVMKIRIVDDGIDPWGYDRDNGAGACMKAINRLRETQSVSTPEMHQEHLNKTADQAMQSLGRVNGSGQEITGLDILAWRLGYTEGFSEE